MKKVYICAPFRGNASDSSQQAKRYTEYALRCGTAPVVPHFCGLNQDSRYAKVCTAAGQSLLWLCDELWIIGDEITAQMKKDIQFSKHLNIRVRNVKEKDITKLIGGNCS